MVGMEMFLIWVICEKIIHKEFLIINICPISTYSDIHKYTCESIFVFY